jgi:hypothetical protein
LFFIFAGQFGFGCCSLAQGMSSVIHYMPYFGGGLLLCLFTGISMLGAYFFALLHFCQAGCIPPAPPAVCVVLQFTVCFSVFGAIWFWMLLSGSGDELCDPIPFLLQGMAYCLPTLSLHCLSCVCLLIVQF